MKYRYFFCYQAYREGSLYTTGHVFVTFNRLLLDQNQFDEVIEGIRDKIDKERTESKLAYVELHFVITAVTLLGEVNE